MKSRDDALEVEAPLLPGSIEQYLAVRVPVCGPDDRAADVRLSLHRQTYDTVADIAVCDGPRLVGLISAERLLAAEDAETAGALMDADPPVVAPGLAQEKAAWKAVSHGESSLAVVDADGTFRGLVPPARLMGVLLHAHDEDMIRLSGVTSSTASARLASEEPVWARLRHRTPWLLVGLLGSALSAVLVEGFESELSRNLSLAFFVPGVVYMADAVGTQTEALIIRGLSVGVSIRRVLGLELRTGLGLGLLLGVAAMAGVWAVLGSFELALTVGISLLAACAVATAVAMGLPWLMSRMGRDPAYGSGPLATVIQDLLSLLSYFLVAGAILT